MKKYILFCFSVLLCAVAYAATITVEPGSGTIKTAVNNATAGDVFVLKNGTYTESSIAPQVAITIKAADGAKPVIQLSNYFQITKDFTLQGLEIQSTKDVIRMADGASLCDITIDNCIFRMGGAEANSARTFMAKQAPNQLKNLLIKNCTFDGGANGTGRMIYLHSGDENNVIPLQGKCEIDHCTFYNSTDTRGVYLANIDGSHVTNCIFMNPTEVSGAVSYALYGSNAKIENSLCFNAPIKLSTGASSVACLVRNPYFVDAANGNFQLYANSPAIGIGTDATNLGDPRWGVSTEDYDNSSDSYIPYKKPYSMAPTTTSVKILWQMNEETKPTDALVYYGTDPNNLDKQIQTNSGWNVTGEGYVHVITLTDLQPDTRYYFTVGASATRRFDKICSTKTAPAAGTAYRIFSISDIHGNSCKNWENMQDFICSLNCDIALMNGDFVSSKGNDRNWNNYFFTPGEKFLSQVPVMSSPGNHETGDPRGLRWSSFYDYFHQFSHEGKSEGDTIDPRGEAYFHFVYGNADVIILNLNFDESSPNFEKDCRQYVWLDSILNECKKPWIIVCHHVGIYTSGYHGQWSEEPKRCAPLLEKYAKQGKRIISLSGDDHSFEHLYKDGVHYLRPGCGRNSNYAQQKSSVDHKYSMYYNKISCFSTFDMSADASTIKLTAYDSVGTVFYTYDFLHEGEVITPAVNFTLPAKEENVEDSIKLQWFSFDPNKDAKVSLYYSQTPNATSVEGMKAIVTNQPNTIEKCMWQTRDIFPKGKYYVYAVITSGGKTYMGGKPAVINLLDDTTPPPAPSQLGGYKKNNQYHLTWNNPTHLVHLENRLTDFSDGIGKMQKVDDDHASMTISVADGALKCDYNLAVEWETTSADYVFDEATDMHRTPILTFRLKGNGTSTPLRIVCKNMSGVSEDWWYTENVNLSNADWQTISLDMRTLSKFDWHGNIDDINHLEGLMSLSFSISYGSPVSGTFYLDDLRLEGEINPAPDFAKTVIVRKDNAFPTSPTDGKEIYSGAAETCTDASAVVGQVYYYAAFAADDRNNWSAPDTGAQWISKNVPEGTGIDSITNDQMRKCDNEKILRDGCLYIRHGENTYTILGQMAK